MAAAFVLRRAFTTLKFASVKCPSVIQIEKRHFSFSKLLSGRVYTSKHEWLLTDGNIGTVGISVHAQDLLGDIVFVETPDVGSHLDADDIAGCVESVKAASEVYSPASGTVTEVNGKLVDKPNLVNEDPLGEGWLYKLELDCNPDKLSLMSEAAYEKYVKEEDDH